MPFTYPLLPLLSQTGLRQLTVADHRQPEVVSQSGAQSPLASATIDFGTIVDADPLACSSIADSTHRLCFESFPLERSNTSMSSGDDGHTDQWIVKMAASLA